jgi:hypothetical protein
LLRERRGLLTHRLFPVVGSWRGSRRSDTPTHDRKF